MNKIQMGADGSLLGKVRTLFPNSSTLLQRTKKIITQLLCSQKV